MNIGSINGVQQNSYIQQSKNVQQIEPVHKIPKVENYKDQIGKPENSEKAKKQFEESKKKLYDLDLSIVSNEKMDVVKADPSIFNFSSQTSVFIGEDELEKMANDKEYAAEIEADIKALSEKIPEIKNELDKKGVPISNLGVIADKGKTNLFAQIDKTQKTEYDKLLDRTKEKITENHEEEIKEIRKKYAPKHRPSDETTIIEREDRITIISNSLLDLSAAISEFGMDYFMKPQQDAGINIDAKA